MFAFLRLAVAGFVLLTLVYLALGAYASSIRRERLERAWDDDPPASGGRASRAEFIETGMRAYRRGLRARLLMGVYVVPAVVVAVLIYLLNVD